MVFRFVLQGTLEELKYLRQVYKNQLKCETIVDVNDIDRKKASRLFRGVAGDDSRKGELFGLENLLKFKNGKFMNYTLRVAESNLYGVGVHDTKSLFEAVKNLSEDELDDIGVEGDLFLRNAGLTKRGTIGSLQATAPRNFSNGLFSLIVGSHGKDRESDCDDEDDLGGMSQAVMDVCEKVNKRVDAVNPHLILEEARPEPVSSLSDDGMTGKHPMSQYNGREKVRTGDMPHADSKLLSRVESVPLACEASTVVVNDAENAANRQFAATNSSTIGTMMPNKSGESSAVAFVRDFTTVFDNYLTGETQSPMNFAVSTKPAATHDVESGTNCSTSNNGGSLLKDSDKAPTGDRSHTNPPKLPPSRNTRVVGKTTSSIRRGESGKTTFKRSDLFLPSAGHKKS